MNLRRNARVKYLFVLLALLVVEPLRCGGPVPAVPAAQFPPAIIILEGKTSQGFPYLSGGVSSDEREVMEERGKAYNVKLVFAEKTGAYLSHVKLAIEDAKREETVSLDTNGPWFYIQLPLGSYGVKATFGGTSNELKALRVTKDKKARHVFVWDLGEALKTAPKT
jgi:hypothetical protein